MVVFRDAHVHVSMVVFRDAMSMYPWSYSEMPMSMYPWSYSEMPRYPCIHDVSRVKPVQIPQRVHSTISSPQVSSPSLDWSWIEYRLPWVHPHIPLMAPAWEPAW